MNYLTPDWPAPLNIKAFTTTRLGWGVRLASPQNPTQAETQQLVSLLNLPNQPNWLTQHHGITVVEAKPANLHAQADASFTLTPNQVCVVMTADCLPVLITNRQGNCVAAVHAGWRGLANGVIENTLALLNQQVNQPAEELLVWLGPAIGPAKFEVGKDVYEAFVSRHAEAMRAFAPQGNEKWLADLYALARLRLAAKGVTTVYGGDYCTYTQEDLFFFPTAAIVAPPAAWRVLYGWTKSNIAHKMKLMAT